VYALQSSSPSGYGAPSNTCHTDVVGVDIDESIARRGVQTEAYQKWRSKNDSKKGHSALRCPSTKTSSRNAISRKKFAWGLSRANFRYDCFRCGEVEIISCSKLSMASQLTVGYHLGRPNSA